MKTEIEEGTALAEIKQRLPLIPWRRWKARVRLFIAAWQYKRHFKRQRKLWVREQVRARRQIKLNEKGMNHE